MAIANDKIDALRREAERLEQNADHYLYGDGGDTRMGTGRALQALVNAVMAGPPVSAETREFDIRKTALVAAATIHANSDPNVNNVQADTLADAEYFESYLRGPVADADDDVETTYDEDDEECEGHYDTDETLLSGAGIGEPTYCDGSCKR